MQGEGRARAAPAAEGGGPAEDAVPGQRPRRRDERPPDPALAVSYQPEGPEPQDPPRAVPPERAEGLRRLPEQGGRPGRVLHQGRRADAVVAAAEAAAAAAAHAAPLAAAEAADPPEAERARERPQSAADAAPAELQNRPAAADRAAAAAQRGRVRGSARVPGHRRGRTARRTPSAALVQVAQPVADERPNPRRNERLTENDENHTHPDAAVRQLELTIRFNANVSNQRKQRTRTR